MALKSKSVDKSKVERTPFVQNGIAVLFKKKSAPVSDAKGIKILPVDPVSMKPDWTADGYVIWFGNLDNLRNGNTLSIPVFLAPYRPKVES